MRPNVALIYVAISVIALSVAAILYRLTPLPIELGVTFGAIIFFALATLDQAVSRAADQKAFRQQMEMSDHAVQDAFNEIDMIRSRLVSLETDTQQVVDAGVAPIHKDLQAVGALLSQVTEAVSDTDHRLVTVEEQMKGLASRALRQGKAQAAQVRAPALPQPTKQTPAPSISASFEKAVQAAKQKAQNEAAEAEARAKKEAEERAQQEAAETAKQTAEIRAKQEAEERRAKQEAEERAKEEAEAREEARSRALLKRVASAVENDRIEVALQSVVTLPLRRARAYATIFNLKLDGAGTLDARHAVPAVEAAGVSDVYDKAVVLRALALAEKFAARESASMVFVPISGAAIMQSRFADWLVNTLGENKDYAGRFVIEITQRDVRAFSPIDFELLSTLADLGFRMSVTQLEDARTDLFELSRHGFRYAKAPASLFLGSDAGAKSDIHPEDLSDLATRNGMDLIVDQVESEAQLVELLECKLKYGQGNLFARARVVDVTPRADIFDLKEAAQDDKPNQVAEPIKLVEAADEPAEASVEAEEAQASKEPSRETGDGGQAVVEAKKPVGRRAFNQSLTPETVAPPSTAKKSSSGKKSGAKKSAPKKATTAKSAAPKSASRPAARRTASASARALSRTA